MNTDQIARRIRALSQRMATLADEIDGGEWLPITHETLAKIAAKECLMCGSEVADGGAKGCCKSCYHSARHLINTGQVTERELHNAAKFVRMDRRGATGAVGEAIAELLNPKEAARKVLEEVRKPATKRRVKKRR